MTKRKAIALSLIPEALYLIWVAFWPTVVAIRFAEALILVTIVAYVVAYWEDRHKKEYEPVEMKDWNAAFSREPEKQGGIYKLVWCVYGVVAVLLLSAAIFWPPVKGPYKTYSEHMPEPLREELTELHGREGQASEPVATYVFDTVTIYVYEEVYYYADRYEEEGLRGLVPRFNDNGKYSCQVEIIRIAKEKYTAKQFARDEEKFYYEAEITNSGKSVEITGRSKEDDPWWGERESLAKEAYEEFEKYRKN